MKVIVISTVRKLRSGDLEEYCEEMINAGVPEIVMHKLLKTNKATWISSDINGEVQTKYEIHELTDD